MVDFDKLRTRGTANVANVANVFGPVISDNAVRRTPARENMGVKKVSNVSNVSTPEIPATDETWLDRQERETPGYTAWALGGELPGRSGQKQPGTTDRQE